MQTKRAGRGGRVKETRVISSLCTSHQPLPCCRAEPRPTPRPSSSLARFSAAKRTLKPLSPPSFPQAAPDPHSQGVAWRDVTSRGGVRFCSSMTTSAAFSTEAAREPARELASRQAAPLQQASWLPAPRFHRLQPIWSVAANTTLPLCLPP